MINRLNTFDVFFFPQNLSKIIHRLVSTRYGFFNTNSNNNRTDKEKSNLVDIFQGGKKNTRPKWVYDEGSRGQSTYTSCESRKRKNTLIIIRRREKFTLNVACQERLITNPAEKKNLLIARASKPRLSYNDFDCQLS